MFIPSTFKRPVSSWKALNLRKTLLMASSVRLKPLNFLDYLAFLALLNLLLALIVIIFIPSTFKPPFLSLKAVNLTKTLLIALNVRLKPLNCSPLPCVYAQETLTFLLTQKKTCVKNYVQKERSEERFSRNAETDLVCRLLLEKKKTNKKHETNDVYMLK